MSGGHHRGREGAKEGKHWIAASHMGQLWGAPPLPAPPPVDPAQASAVNPVQADAIADDN